MIFNQYRTIQRGEFFVAAGDTGMGAGDWNVMQFLSKTKCDVPLVYRTKQPATQMTNDVQPVLEKLFDITGIRPLVAYERNNGGSFELDRLGKLNRSGKYSLYLMPQNTGAEVDPSEGHKYGWSTNTATRPIMLQDLKDAIDGRILTVYDEQTINEFFSFILVQTNTLWKAQADKNAHDDHVMALAIAWQLYLRSPSALQMKKTAAVRPENRQFRSVQKDIQDSKRLTFQQMREYHGK